MLRQGLRALAGAVSPIELFAANQGGKLARGVGELPAAFASLTRQYKATGRNMLGDYFAGHSLQRVAAAGGDVSSMMQDAAYQTLMQRNQALRMGVVGSAAMAYPVSFVTGDSAVTRMGDAGVGATAAMVGAGALAHMPGGLRHAGWGFIGLSAFNLVRSGDQWGPF